MAKDREIEEDGFYNDPLGNSAEHLPQNYGQAATEHGPKDFFDDLLGHSSEHAPQPRRLNVFEDPLDTNSPARNTVSTARRGNFAREQAAAIFKPPPVASQVGLGHEVGSDSNGVAPRSEGSHVPKDIVSSLTSAMQPDGNQRAASSGKWRITGNLFEDSPTATGQSPTSPRAPTDFGPRGGAPRGR